MVHTEKPFIVDLVNWQCVFPSGMTELHFETPARRRTLVLIALTAEHQCKMPGMPVDYSAISSDLKDITTFLKAALPSPPSFRALWSQLNPKLAHNIASFKPGSGAPYSVYSTYFKCVIIGSARSVQKTVSAQAEDGFPMLPRPTRESLLSLGSDLDAARAACERHWFSTHSPDLHLLSYMFEAHQEKRPGGPSKSPDITFLIKLPDHWRIRVIGLSELRNGARKKDNVNAKEDDPYVLYDHALVLFQRGDYKSAIPLLERVTRHISGDSQIWLHLGSSYAKIGDAPRAIEPLQKAYDLESEPCCPQIHIQLARALWDQKRTEEALMVLTERYAHLREQPILLDEYYKSLMRLGRFSEVIKAARLKRGRVHLFYVALCEYKRGNVERARAVVCEDDSDWITFNLSSFESGDRRRDLDMHGFLVDPVIREKLSEFSLRLALAHTIITRGSGQIARRVLAKLLMHFPSHSETVDHTIWEFESKLRWAVEEYLMSLDKAREIFRSCSERWPPYERLFFEGVFAVQDEDYRAAASCFRRALDAGVLDVLACTFNLALCRTLHEHPEPVSIEGNKWNAVLEITPYDLLVYEFELDCLLRSAQCTDDVVARVDKYYKRLVDENCDPFLGHFARFVLFHRRQQYDSAAHHLELARRWDEAALYAGLPQHPLFRDVQAQPVYIDHVRAMRTASAHLPSCLTVPVRPTVKQCMNRRHHL